ncbi:MAG TPA: NapC/NirT family cytochrome c [Kofleriaceae bacterium]|nr:NapC/NirT family cytochrome c [Kofleriaceae bacterium]
MVSWIISNPLIAAAIACAAAAALLLVWYLVRRPALSHATKLVLLAGIGVLPLATAMTGNVAGYEATKSRQFCGACHVMTPYKTDSEDRHSTALAARHARNALFGEDNCYACHADYGMFGTITTKLGGLRHVYEYTFHYRNMPLDEARDKIHILRPFQNATCMHCHSTEGPTWNAVKEHASLLVRVRGGEVSCASEGCHGPAHPFSKPAQPPHKEQAP